MGRRLVEIEVGRGSPRRTFQGCLVSSAESFSQRSGWPLAVERGRDGNIEIGD